jgi:hypothetical protein
MSLERQQVAGRNKPSLQAMAFPACFKIFRKRAFASSLQLQKIERK